MEWIQLRRKMFVAVTKMKGVGDLKTALISDIEMQNLDLPSWFTVLL